MDEKIVKPERTEDKRVEMYNCPTCKQTYEVSQARKKEFACCGQRLLPFEVITKSDPTPFGP